LISPRKKGFLLAASGRFSGSWDTPLVGMAAGNHDRWSLRQIRLPADWQDFWGKWGAIRELFSRTGPSIRPAKTIPLTNKRNFGSSWDSLASTRARMLIFRREGLRLGREPQRTLKKSSQGAFLIGTSGMHAFCFMAIIILQSVRFARGEQDVRSAMVAKRPDTGGIPEKVLEGMYSFSRL